MFVLFRRCFSDGVCGAFTLKGSLGVTQKEKTEATRYQVKAERYTQDTVSMWWWWCCFCPLASPGWRGRTNISMCHPWALARSGTCNVHLHGDRRRRVGFFLCWLLIESHIFLVNWWSNGLFGEIVGSCTQVSDEAVLKDRNLHLLCKSS